MSIKKILFLITFVFIQSCGVIPEEIEDFYKKQNLPIHETNTQQQTMPKSNVKMYAKEAVHTQEVAEKFSLELPMRCMVDWETQKVIQAQPYDRAKIKLTRTDKGDPLPILRVDDLYFKNTPVNEVLTALLKNTGIQIVSFDQYYNNITLDIGGKLSDVIEIVTKTGGFFIHMINGVKH